MRCKSIVVFCLLLMGLQQELYAQTPRAAMRVDAVPATKGQTILACVGSNVAFTSFASNANFYRWRFENGTPATSTATSVNVRFNSPGVYKAVQTVSFTNGGEEDSTWVFINVSNTFPRASFTYTPTAVVCGSSNFQFTSNSTGTGLTYRWTFGDGGTSTLQNPVYQFNNAIGNSGNANYNVVLTVTNNSKCSHDTTIQVRVLRIPDGQLGTSDPNVQYLQFNGVPTFRRCSNVASYVFPFINQSTTTATNTSYTIIWGDGSPDTSFTTWAAATPISHSFPLGNTTMTMVVRGSSTCETRKKYNIFVGSNPAAGFASQGNTDICAPDTLGFITSGFETNAPGTIYRYSVNDGTAPETFLHPPPAIFRHGFISSSCGISSSNGAQTFTNSFRTNLEAENPCGSTSLSVIPIRVSGTPNAFIGMSSPNLCVNSSITISNTGDFGGIINPTGGGNSTCDNVGTQVWRITPATGFTVVSGSMGSLNGSPLNGALWTNGSTGMDVRFTQTGTYRVKLYLANSRCGLDSVEEVICVRNPPIPSFTLDRKTFCGPGNVKATNRSVLPAGCGSNSYNWQIRYADPEGCAGPGGASFVNGTSDTSANPEIRFVNAGRYILDLSIVTDASGCGSPVFSDTIIVKGPPDIAVSGLAAICAGSPLTPTATASSCYSPVAPTYAWTFTNGTPASSALLAPGTINYALAGRHPIRLRATNECGTTTIDTAIQIGVQPVITNIPAKSICSGADVQLPLATTVAGSSFSWTSSVISGSVAGNTNSGYVNVTSINDILENTGSTAAVVEYRIVAQGPAASLCVSNPWVVRVTVSTGAASAMAGPDQYLCNVSSTSLDGNIPAVGTGVWSQVAGPAATISNTADPKATISGLLANNVYRFAWTITGTVGGCAISVDEVEIFVRPLVTTPDAGKDSSFCAASVTDYTMQGNTLLPFETGTWSILSYTTASSPILNGSNDPAAVLSGLSVGNVRLEWRITNDAGCPPIADEVLLTIGGGPETADAGPNQLICAAQQATLAAAVLVNGNGLWTQIAGLPASIADPLSPSTNVTNLLPGNSYTFQWAATAPNPACGTNTSLVVIELRPELTVPNAGPDSSFCAATVSSYTLQGNAVRPFENGTWTVISATAGTPQLSDPYNPKAVLAGLELGTIRLEWRISNDLGCGSVADTVDLLVGSGPVQARAGVDQFLCATTQVTLNGNIATSGSGFWTETSGLGAIIANPSNASTTVSNIIPGNSYTFRYTITADNPACGTSMDEATIAVRLPVEKPNAGRDESLCAAGGNSYILQGSAPSAFETGTWQIISYTTAGLPVISNVNDPNAILSNLSPGNVRLQWSMTNDLGCAPLTDTVTITIGGGSIEADAGSDQTLCAVTQTFLNGNTPSSGTGLWTQESGAIVSITNNTSPSTTITGLVPGTYSFRWTVTASISTCGSSFDLVTIVVRPPITTPHAGPDESICAAGSSSYTLQGNTPRAFETGTWKIISFTTAGLPAINNVNDPGATLTNLSEGIVRLQWSITNDVGCTPLADTLNITIGAGAIQADAGTDQTICNTTQAFLSGSLPSAGEGSWQQVSGAPATIADAASPSTTVTGLAPGRYVFRWTVTAANPSCGSSFDEVEVTVRPSITQPNAGKDTNICTAGNLIYTLEGNGYGAFEAGTWKIISFTTAGRPVLSDVNDPNAQLSNLSAGHIRLEWVISNDVGCVPLADTVDILIGQGPVQAVAGADQTICAATQVSLSANTPSSGSGLWTRVSGPAVNFTDATNASTTVTGLIPGSTYTFRWTITAGLTICGTSSDDVRVTVRPALTLPNAGSDSTVCAASVPAYTLQGNTVRTFERGRWALVSYTTATRPVISDILNPNALLSNLSVGRVRLEWRVSNDLGCPSIADTVELILAESPTQAMAGNDQQLCNQPATQLEATPAANGFTGQWSILSSGSAQLANPLDAGSGISALPEGHTTLVWTVTNDICPASTDTVVIAVYPSLVNITGSPQTICNGQQAQLLGNEPAGGNGVYTYQWQASTNNISFSDLSGENTASLTLKPQTTTWYRRMVSSLPCTSFSDAVLVTVQPPIINNIINASQAICDGGASATIVGNTPTGGDGSFTYRWQQSVDTGKTWATIANAAGKDFAPGILPITTQYRRLATSGYCIDAEADTSQIITITVNPHAQALFAPTIQQDCAPFQLTPATINLTAYPAANANYRWHVNDSLIGMGDVFPGYLMAADGDSIMLKLVALSRFGCKNDSMQFAFTTLPRPATTFTLSDSVGCGAQTIQFTNTTPYPDNFGFAWDFGNGQTSTLAQPGPIFFDINPNFGDTVYTVRLKAFNQCDTVEQVQFVRVRAKAKALIALDQATGCSPMQVVLANVSRGGGANYIWDFGDGSPLLPSNAATVQHTYTTPVRDTFFVKLYSENDCGKDTQQYAIVVNPGLIAIDVNINGNQINGCLPHTVMFVNNTVGANLFRWDFGDGSPQLTTTKGVDTLVHTYTTTGTFAIQVFATNSCTDTVATETVTVQVKPEAAFTPEPAIACVGQAIQMSNTSTPNIAYNWRFGDGSTSSLSGPVKKYDAPGTYQIWLVASRAFPQGLSCTDSTFADVVINDSLPGNFTITGLENCAPFAVTFTNNDRPATATTWHFGDGTQGNGDSLAHVYTTPGQYFVKMVSKSVEGCVLTASQTITVTGPVGELRYKSGPACLGEPIRFEALANNASSYRFYFGNGDSITSSSPIVTYTYARDGNYLPSVLLIGGNCTKLVFGKDSIQVDQVRAGFSYSSIQACGITNYQFTDTSSARSGVVLRNWDFGDGGTATTANPIKGYTVSGLYNVRQIITSAHGCKDTLTLPLAVEVWAVPTAAIVSDSLACIADMLHFAAAVQSADSIVGNNWSFGNGLTGAGASVSTQYGQGGFYTVTLTSTSSKGCADTVSKTIRISVAPLINAGRDTRICLGQSANLNAAGGTTYQWTPTEGLSCANCANPVATPTTTTQYVVTGRNQYSCPKNDTIVVEVIQPFAITVSGNDTLCLGESRQISAAGAFSYLWSPATGLNANNIQNPLATPTVTTRYQVVGYDNYNCFTDTGYITVAVGQIPTVDIGTGSTVPAGTEVRLQPRYNNGPFDRYTWMPPTDLSCANCPSPIATVNSNITYRVEVENIYHCTAADTISFKVICNKEDQLYIPNAFSPDGDGINDVLMVRGRGIAQVKIFRVFNRYGQIVFEKANFAANDPSAGWDGRIKGVPAAKEVYIVTAEALCGGGELFKYQGNVTLFR